MAHHVEFFCKAGMSNADGALDVFLRALAERGTAVDVRERHGDAGAATGEVAAVPAAGDGEPAGSVVLNFRTGEAALAGTIAAVANEPGAQRVAGSDLHVTAILSGDQDWRLFESIWATLADLWQAVTFDEESGFDV